MFVDLYTLNHPCPIEKHLTRSSFPCVVEYFLSSVISIFIRDVGL